MAKAKKKRGPVNIRIKEGTCRTIKSGSVRVCMNKTNGALRVEYRKPPKRQKKAAGVSGLGALRSRGPRRRPASCATMPTKARKGYKGRWTCISQRTGRVLLVKGWGIKRRKY